MNKRADGMYFTRGNPFNNIAFSGWAAECRLRQANVQEPFAGQNSLIETLQGMGLCNKFTSFDIHPQHNKVAKRDTMKRFPTNHEVCVTNPPWLAKNSATVRRLPFPDTQYDNVYKCAVNECLQNCSWVAALVPESFIKSGLFQNRLTHFVSLSAKMFQDTGHPVGLALFSPETTQDVMVWHDSELVGQLSMLKKNMPSDDKIPVRFNIPKGNVGLIALDNTRTESIRFCEVKELAEYEVRSSGRHITKIDVDGKIKIKEWNNCLTSFRAITKDVLMTCYKGIRKDGQYRRRLDWGLTRSIISYVG